MNTAQRFKIAGLVAAATVATPFRIAVYFCAGRMATVPCLHGCACDLSSSRIASILPHSKKLAKRSACSGSRDLSCEGGFWQALCDLLGLLLTLLAYLLLGTQSSISLCHGARRYAFAAFWH